MKPESLEDGVWGQSPQPILAGLFALIAKLKLRNFAKLCFFKLIMTKSNFKKSIMTSF